LGFDLLGWQLQASKVRGEIVGSNLANKPHHWPSHLTSYKKHWDFEPINKGHPFNIA
jgi:hypothetical protein